MTNQTPTIFVPYQLVEPDRNGQPHSFIRQVRQYALPIYIYLSFRRGVDGLYYGNLKDILRDGCGYQLNSNAYNRGYLDHIKQAITYLQEQKLIGSVTTRDGEVVDTIAIKPADSIWIDLSPAMGACHARFQLMSSREYKKLLDIQTANVVLYWKSLVLFFYIRSKLQFSPATDQARNNSWRFTDENVSFDLEDGFSRPTVANLFSLLKEHQLIYWEFVYTPPVNNVTEVNCIGKVVISMPDHGTYEPISLFREEKTKTIQEYLSYMNIPIYDERATITSPVCEDVKLDLNTNWEVEYTAGYKVPGIN